MKAKTLQRRRKILVILGVLGGLWALGSWILYPGYLLLTTPPLSSKARSTVMPSFAVLHHLDTYHQVMASPFYRRLAQSRAAQLLSRHVHTARIERSLRNTLLDQNLTEWFAIQAKWHKLLSRLQKQFPRFHLKAYRVYLYLQAGQLQRLKEWGERLPPQEVPKLRQTTLMRAWLGHAAFFGGWPKQAKAHYLLAVKAFNQHPAWDIRSSKNWRLPAELSAILYHLGLLEMRANNPKQALHYFRRMSKRWTAISSKYRSMSLWYLSQQWSAEACFLQNKIGCARKHLEQASQFSKDPTLRLLLQSRLPHQTNATLTTVIASHRQHTLSYADSPHLARLLKALHLSKQSKKNQANRLLEQVLHALKGRPWPVTLGVLHKRNSRNIRYIPLAPSIYTKLLRALHKAAPTSMRRELKMYRMLSYLRLYDWETAQRELDSLLKKNPNFSPLFLYQGILALQKNQSHQAYRWLSKYHKAKNSKISTIYMARATMLTRPKQMKHWLQQLKSKKVRASLIQRLRDTWLKKPFSRKLNKAQYWWRVLGYQGILAIHDRTLRRQSHIWRVRAKLSHQAQPKEMFRSMHVSHHMHRHSLATWLGRYRYLSMLFPAQKQEYLRRLRYIQSFYRAFPRLWYQLDRTTYSNQWGLLALGFH